MPTVQSARRLPDRDPGTREVCEAVVQRLESDVDYLAARMTDAVIEEIPVYQGMSSPSQRATIHAHSLEHVRAVIECIRSWTLPPVEALAFVRERAGLRANQQVPLSALLHAYRVGHRTVWERLVRILEDSPGGNPLDATLALTTMTLTYTELISTTLAEGYVEHQRDRMLQVARARRDLLETLLRGDAESRADMAELASSFALVPGADFVVVVLARSADTDSRAADVLRRHLALALAQPFVVARHREVISIAPIARARPVAIARLVRQAHAELTELGEQWTAGISTVCGGLGEVARGYQEARQAVFGGVEGVHALLEQRVHEYIVEHADGTAARMIPPVARSVLTSEPLLVETLRAYAQAEMSVRDTASLLFVHSNTVVYRLEKLGRLLGCDVMRFSNLVEVLTWLTLLEPL